MEFLTKMSTAKKNIKKPQTKKITTYLYKVKKVALSNNRYRWGIDIFEKHRRKYIFSDRQLYTLGLLYDHLAMFNEHKNMKKEKIKKYLKEAEFIYHSILKREPKSDMALYGIGRVWNIRNNHEKALFYQRKAYKLMQKLPKKERGTMAIGALYGKIGNYKKAEEWYKKEYNNLKNDFGATLNLFLFYKRMKNYDKAQFYLPKAEHLLKKEFRKDVYRGLGMRKNKWLKYLSKQLEDVRKAKGSG